MVLRKFRVEPYTILTVKEVRSLVRVKIPRVNTDNYYST